MWLTKILDFLKPKLPDLLVRSFYEDDGRTVSSSRIMGALTFFVLHFCNVVLVSVITYSIFKVVKMAPIDNQALTSLLGSIKYLSLLYLILAATALALYRINIWKYVSAIKNGVNSGVDSVEDAIEQNTKKVQTTAMAPGDSSVLKPTKSEATPQKSQVSSTNAEDNEL